MTNFDNDKFNKESVWRILAGQPGTWYQEANEDERALLRDWTRDLLHEQEIEIKFTKADGTVRSMQCTLNEDLGAVHVNTGGSGKPINDNVCVVWDCKQQEWRSFRWDRLRTIEVKL